jgi:hypothetical protein
MVDTSRSIATTGLSFLVAGFCGPDRGLKALKSDEDQYLELPLKVRLLAICICGSTTNLTNPFNAPIAAPY